MIPRNAAPIAHVTPRPRIQIGQADVRPDSAQMVTTVTAIQEIAEMQAKLENARIWSLIKGAAEGSNVISSPVVSDDWSD